MLNKILSFLIFLSFFISCGDASFSKETSKKTEEGKTDVVPKVSNITYGEMKEKIDDLRLLLNKEYIASANKKTFLDSTSMVFSSFLVDSLIPYWYGTPWTFTGHTDTPNRGEVACGYFVSTTLKHMGLNLNRYKMAQQASKLEVSTIALTADNVTFMSNISLENISKLDEGLYVVGLDNHVGYILRQPKVTYFIHSDYVSGGVIRQRIEEAPAFQSQVYYFGKITDNHLLIKKWLKGEKVKVVVP